MILLAITILIAAASYRTWRFLALDTITVPLRARLFFCDPEVGKFRRYGRVGLYYWTCPWCLGTWITIAVTILTDLIVGIPMPVLIGAAACAGTGYIGAYDPDQDFSSGV